MVKRKLTYELCEEIALKFNHIHELQLEDASVYGKIRDNKWLELLSHMTKPENKNIIWTYEKCKEEISKLKYYNELQGTTLYNVIKKNGWVDELTSHLIRVQRKPYTKEDVLNESIKYKTRNDFQVGSPGAYGAAKRLNIMSEATKHMGKSPNDKQYTKEEILISARKYKNQRDWYNNEPSVCRCARGYGKPNKSKEDREFWDECISHMDYVFKPNNYWTYERCEEVAKTFNTHKEFRKSDKFGSVYQKIRKKKWDELIEHLTMDVKPPGYWTYEMCKETALKYTDRKELNDNEGSCYRIITANGWNELLSHIEYKTTLFHRFIYAFEFPDNHVYVGLTYNLNKRKSDHLTSNKSVSPVREHMKKTGLDFVFKCVFDESFPKEIAVEMEGKVLNDYISKGWIPLNRAKTGSLGGSQVIWTYDKIKKDLEGIETLSEAKKKLPPWVFHIIKKFGWNDLLSKLLVDVRVLWTIETATEELKKYSRRCDIQHNQSGLYKFARKNNLLHLVPRGKPIRKNPLKDKFTKEEVYEICLTYNTTEEIKKGNREYYTCAKNNGWLDDITKQLKDKRGIKSKYSYEECLNTALRYQHKSDFQEENSGMFKVILKNGWWEEMKKHMVPKPRDRYKLQEVIDICKNYTFRGKLLKEKPGVYKYIKRHNLIDELLPIK